MLTESDGAATDSIEKEKRADTIDLSENNLKINISDSLSDKETVKFTVHTVILNEGEYTVIRLHEEFMWLHDQLNINPEYAGVIIPPPPPTPNFTSSREKLKMLNETENTLTKEEYEKMKAELEAEYLALFKKTVSMHEVFLQRLAAHPMLKNDDSFTTFYKYKDDLSVRGKNAKEQLGGFFRSLSKTADEVLILNHKETDEFIDGQRRFLVTYNAKIKDAVIAADKATRVCKNVPNGYIKISSKLIAMATAEQSDLAKYFQLLGDFFERSRRIESRIQSDTDLKLSDTLRYYAEDSKAALNLLYRRSRCFTDLETANKTLDRARVKNKDVSQAEANHQNAKDRFEKISEKTKEELKDFKTRRVQMFKKSLVELSELQIKHTKSLIQTIKIFLQQAEKI